VACYAVAAVRQFLDATGAPAIQLELSDADSRVSAVVTAAEPLDWLRAGGYVGIRGTVEFVAGQPRIRVDALSPLRVALDDLSLFLPRSPRDQHELEAQLTAAIDSVREPALHALLVRVLGPDRETGRGFRLAPAATRNHHAYLGGLLEHTLSVTRLCDSLASHYGVDVDRDLLITAALLHDVGKVREIGAQVGFPYTDEGRLLGHILLGLRMIEEAAARVHIEPARLLLLQHLIASHQGRYEWQSPREPRILEAIILHYVDDLDAKVHHAQTLLHAVEAGWTDYDRAMGRELLRHQPAAIAAPPKQPAASRAVAAPGRKRERANRGNGKKKPGARASRAARKGAGKNAARRRRPERPADATTPAGGSAVFIDRDTLDLFAQENQRGPARLGAEAS
jgi:3'-5' exoribonuclease